MIARFDELCRIAAEFEALAEKSREARVRPLEKGTSPAGAARQIRQEFALEDRPVRNLRQLLEGLGAWTFELKVPNNIFSGLSNWHEEYGPCILVNASDPPGRRQFTLAHEYAHLIHKEAPCVCEIHLQKSPSLIREERAANQFAVELLMPEGGIAKDFRKRRMPSSPTERELGNMAGRWKVSMQALGYRLESLQLVEQDYTDELVAKWKAKPARFSRPKTPTWERRLGERFVSAAITAYKKGRISIGKLAHSFDIPIRKAHDKYT